MAIPKSSMSPLEHQQFMRLKVNRVAVIQELKVDHIVHYLQSKSVLDDGDLMNINKGRSTSEKSRRLLDILPTKGRSSNWYKHFRAALLNPSVDDSLVKHKYQILVEFLDNTIIDNMSHPIRLKPKLITTDYQDIFPKHTRLPGITANSVSRPPTIAASGKKTTPSSVFNHEVAVQDLSTSQLITEEPLASPPELVSKWSMQQLQGTKIPYSVEYWDKDPEGFASVLVVPIKEIEILEQSSAPAEIIFGEQERDAVDRMKQLEIAYFLLKNQESREDMVLCTCSAALHIIQDTLNHHLYFKYFEHLQSEYGINLALELVNSYDEVTQWLTGVTDNKSCEQLVDIGLNIISFLSDYGKFSLAQQTALSIEAFMKNHTEMWILLFNFYVTCMALNNSSGDSLKAKEYHSIASALRDKIGKAMSSFGQETLDSSEFFRQTSIMLAEQGNFASAYTFSQKAMQDIDLENKATVVKVLCTASVAYSNQWKLMRSEDLAVEAVQQAKILFGIYHPVYLLALQNFVNFSNQFRKDRFGVEASMFTLNLSKRLYRYDNSQVAQAYAGHALALLAAKQYDGLYFFKIATQANDIASNLYPIHSILTTSFIQTLVASILQAVKLSTEPKKKEELSLSAERLCKQLITINELHSSAGCHKIACAHLLLAEVYILTNCPDDATKCLETAIQLLSTNLGTKHGSVHKVKVRLAKVVAASSDLDRAKTILTEILENFDAATYYMDWYNEMYELLISCCESHGNDELIKEYKSKHMGWKWISEDSQRKISWRQLNSLPEGYDSFLEKFELWRSNLKKVRQQIDQQKLASETMETS